MKKLKKVYVEITNSCNLSCSFCKISKRDKKFMSEEEFAHILMSLKDYTDYLYLHILGEPLLHPKINEFIDMASLNYKINLTTNGYLIHRIANNKNIRQINISLHSFAGDDIEEYLENIFQAAKRLVGNGTIINYRLWTMNDRENELVKHLEKHYGVEIVSDNQSLSENVFINFSEEFEWPSVDKDTTNDIGTCLALKDHLGILSSGVVVPCCLDTEGDIDLGNIFDSGLEEILASEKVIKMIEEFRNNKKSQRLCQTCNFYK